MNAPIKVDMHWTEYKERGLLVPAKATDGTNVVDARALGVFWSDGPVGSEITVFDRDLNFTRHRILQCDDNHVVIGPAEPWPSKS